MTHLPMRDYRCLDDHCPSCGHCLRYLDRKSADDDTPIASTLRYNAIVNGQIISECKHFLKAD